LEATEIITNSQQRLHKLQPLLHFFDHELLVMISVRTKLIHEVFESNAALSIDKLELFHLQYTDVLLQLLRKIKQNNAQQYQLLLSEININQQFIQSYQKELLADVFFKKIIEHNLAFQALLAQYYEELAYAQKPNFNLDFAQIQDFAQRYAAEYFREIPSELLAQILQQQSQNCYQSPGFSIDKRLMGKLNIQQFKFKLVAGFRAEQAYLLLYKCIHTADYFVLNQADFSLFAIELSDFSGLDISKNQSNKQHIVAQLLGRNQALQHQAELVLKQMPQDALDLLNDYLAKISEIDLLQHLQNIDEQTLVLKTMLNMKIE
jgi:hypothetical protein